ncbi:UNVERIFIED_CONTAM: Alpha-amylase 3, chloroplastic [Sesamum radiatum]|uniref:alpha-amylase n=1 Tax=Sesamum radiatum TaxID=300843 RepID=A0AAW2JR81_SESRA
MSTVATDSLLLLHHHHHIHRASLRSIPKFQLISKKLPPFHLICSQASDSRFNNGASLCYRYPQLPRALSSTGAAVVETSESSVITFSETFELNRTEKCGVLNLYAEECFWIRSMEKWNGFKFTFFVFSQVEGKITIRLDSGKNEKCWRLTIGCTLPGKWVLHWGVNYVGDVDSEWDQPPPDMRPSGSITIKDYAIETPFETKSALREGEAYYEVTIEFSKKTKIAAINFVLKQKNDRDGSWGSFVLDEGLFAFVFVLKLNENTWLNCKGNDFYIPFSSSVALDEHSGLSRSEVKEDHEEYGSPMISGSASESKEAVPAYTDEIINEIRNLVNDISSEKSRETKSKEAHEIILQEIEKLAAEAYSIFRSSLPTLPEANLSKEEVLQPPVKITSGTGSGFEILCQGFNWESHKSGKWYVELHEKTSKLSSLGFTVIWLPPPTDSVSPEGYMPRDLYNLNSREEIGYDGWRLDFVRGFWGGYVKDYMDSSTPYFAVGEYWDSLSYTYGEMDHNQDAHRQRIVDWINATNGTAGAFDVTTKGILHSVKIIKAERDVYAAMIDEKLAMKIGPGHYEP